jgi:hypothetical protein
MKRTRADFEKILDTHFEKLKHDLIELFEDDFEKEELKQVPLILIPVDLGAPMTLSVVQREDKDNFSKKYIGGDSEYHVSAYAIRKQLPENLKTIHEQLCFACDENGYYKNLPVNLRASQISGIKMSGPIVMFLENGTDYGEITLQMAMDLHDHTKNLYK